MEKIIEVKNLGKQFGGCKVVDNISFNVKKGELFGFLGVNGAGKSTTINMLCTLYEKTCGEADICGLKLGIDNKEIRKKIGVVFQENSMDDLLTVKDNLIFRAYLYEHDKKKIKQNIEKVCDILKIGDYLNKRFQTLSGGQKRSCDIACALMHTPEILFLDEPTTGLDPKTRKNLWSCIEYLRQEEKMTIFLTTHYMEEAAKAQNIAVIDKGKIIEYGTPFDFKEKYASDMLKIDCINKKEVLNILTEKGLKFKEDTNRINVNIPNSIYCIDILKQLKKYINSFEVVQGTMEDAFLNITRQRREEL